MGYIATLIERVRSALGFSMQIPVQTNPTNLHGTPIQTVAVPMESEAPIHPEEKTVQPVDRQLPDDKRHRRTTAGAPPKDDDDAPKDDDGGPMDGSLDISNTLGRSVEQETPVKSVFDPETIMEKAIARRADSDSETLVRSTRHWEASREEELAPSKPDYIDVIRKRVVATADSEPVAEAKSVFARYMDELKEKEKSAGKARETDRDPSMGM